MISKAHAEKLLQSLVEDKSMKENQSPSATMNKEKSQVNHICLSEAKERHERKSGQVYSDDIILQKSPTSKEIRFCRKCGEKLPEDSQYCNKCGTKVWRDLLI